MQEFQSMLQLLKLLASDPRIDMLFLLLLLAAVTDYRSYRIPNSLTVTGTLLALALTGALSASPWSALGWSLLGLGIGFMLMLPFYVIGVMGAGDVKLMAMVGAFLGVPGVLYAVLATFIAGGVLALAVVLGRGLFNRTLCNIRMLLQALAMSALGGIRPDLKMDGSRSVGKMPYGISIAIGTAGYVIARQLGYL